MTVATHDQTQDRGINPIRYEMVRDNSRSFDGLAVWANDTLNLTGDGTGNGEPVQAQVTRVSATFFSLLGVQPQLPGADGVAGVAEDADEDRTACVARGRGHGRNGGE